MFGLGSKNKINALEKRLAYLERKTDAAYTSIKWSLEEMQSYCGLNDDNIGGFSCAKSPLGAFEINEEFNGTDKDNGLLQQDLTNYR